MGQKQGSHPWLDLAGRAEWHTYPLPRGHDGQMSGYRSSTWNRAWDPVSAQRQGARWGCSCYRASGNFNLRIIGASGGVMGEAGGAEAQRTFKAVLGAVPRRSLEWSTRQDKCAAHFNS